jgi:hypothetical protein
METVPAEAAAETSGNLAAEKVSEPVDPSGEEGAKAREGASSEEGQPKA